MPNGRLSSSASKPGWWPASSRARMRKVFLRVSFGAVAAGSLYSLNAVYSFLTARLSARDNPCPAKAALSEPLQRFPNLRNRGLRGSSRVEIRGSLLFTNSKLQNFFHEHPVIHNRKYKAREKPRANQRLLPALCSLQFCDRSFPCIGKF